MIIMLANFNKTRDMEKDTLNIQMEILMMDIFKMIYLKVKVNTHIKIKFLFMMVTGIKINVMVKVKNKELMKIENGNLKDNF